MKSEMPTVITVYRGAAHDVLHKGMFVSECADTASEYGTVRTYDLEIEGVLNTLDPAVMEKFLPLTDPYDGAEIDTVEAYEDRLSDTWGMVEDAQLSEYPVLRISEGGVVNYLVNDPARLTLQAPMLAPGFR